MLSLRAHVWIFLGLLAATILLAVAGNVLSAAGYQPMLDRLQLPLRILFLGLVLALVLAFVPVMVKLVIGAQIKTGGLAGGLANHQGAIIWVFWALIAAGLSVAVPAAIEDNFLGTSAEMATASGPNQAGPISGTLVAAPGMRVGEMLAQSSLKPEGGGKGDIPFAGGAVFDLRVAGTPTILKGCRYYFVSRESRDPDVIQALSIGTSPRKLSRSELDAANAALRRQLREESWRPGHEEYKTAENQRLHGGATRGEEGWVWLRNGFILHIETRRMDDPVAGEDSATAGAWIQFVDLWPETEYPGREFLVFAAPAP